MGLAENLLIDSILGTAVLPDGIDRTHRILLSAFAGFVVSDYADDIAGIGTQESAWAHSVVSGGQMPALVLPDEDGYPLTHAVFYATDFTRRPITNQAALDRVVAASADTDSPDLLCEYGLCMIALGSTPTKKTVDAISLDSQDEHLLNVSRLFDARR